MAPPSGPASKRPVGAWITAVCCLFVWLLTLAYTGSRNGSIAVLASPSKKTSPFYPPLQLTSNPATELTVVRLPGIKPFLLVTHEGRPPYAHGDKAQLQILADLGLAARCGRDPGTLVVDIGGFLGDFGLTAAACGCSVVIFEVQPAQLELIQASISINGFQDRVTLLQRAVSDTSGQRFSFAPSGGTTAVVDGGSIAVETATLDELFAGQRIFFLKVDVEGLELKVLQGARRLFREGLVSNVVFEYTAFWMERVNQKELLPFVQSLGPKAMYALHRTSADVYGPLTQAQVDAFHETHFDDSCAGCSRLQTDVFATFTDSGLASMSRALPYTQGVLA